jgi:translocator protein
MMMSNSLISQSAGGFVGIGKSTAGLVGWLVVSFATGWIGSRSMPGAWYASLAKPSWNPPSAIFAPVWSVLYVLMGVAAWLVWRKAGFSGAGAALVLFIVQLVLNTLWSYLFFGLHRPDLAFFDIVALWVVILIIVVLFWRVDRLAGGLMLPYVVWVTFASYLNHVLWRLNAGLISN